MSSERQLGTVKVEFATSDTAVVALVGEHDLHSREALSATLASAAEGRNVLVDLSRCSFVDSAIISLLLVTQRTVEQHDGRCELVIPAQAGYVTRLFEITGIAGLFRVHHSRNVGFASMAEGAALPAARAA
jgi:anti-anti-sigma factor